MPIHKRPAQGQHLFRLNIDERAPNHQARTQAQSRCHQSRPLQAQRLSEQAVKPAGSQFHSKRHTPVAAFNRQVLNSVCHTPECCCALQLPVALTSGHSQRARTSEPRYRSHALVDALLLRRWRGCLQKEREQSCRFGLRLSNRMLTVRVLNKPCALPIHTCALSSTTIALTAPNPFGCAPICNSARE